VTELAGGRFSLFGDLDQERRGRFVRYKLRKTFVRAKHFDQKNYLKLVENEPTLGAPPRKLGKHGLALWRSITAEYGVDDAGGIEMLLQACQALDRSEACRDHIDRDGEVIRSKAGLKDHPALKHEIANRSFVVRTLHRLGLDVEAVRPIGRPPGFGEL
jgi:hypothetical protein